jgi:hypothetical protein
VVLKANANLAGPFPELLDPLIRKEILNHPELQDYLKDIKSQVLIAGAQAPESLPYGLYKLFDTTGNRLEYQSRYFDRRRNLLALGLAGWLLTSDPKNLISIETIVTPAPSCALTGLDSQKIIDDLQDLLWAICEEYTWCLPAHLGGESLNPELIAGSRFSTSATRGSENSTAVVTKNSVQKATASHDQTLDLFACETGFALAEILYCLGDRIDPVVRERVRSQVFYRVLDPFLARKEPWPWELMVNNWCAVCGGSLGAIALYLADDPEHPELLNRILDRILPTLDRFLDSFADDGACLEGLGYWTYGLGFYVSFADLLYRRTGGAIDLMAGEKFARIARFQQACYLGSGCTVSFADGFPKDTYRRGLTHYLINRIPGVSLPFGGKPMGFTEDVPARWCLGLRDLVWSLEKNEVAQNDLIASHGTNHGGKILQSQYFADAQWLVCPSTGAGKLAFAAKGGHNDEPHNHNDIGSFILTLDQQVYLTDLGCGEYTKEYFSSGRYGIFCNNSLGHSVPIISGQGQGVGPEFRAESPVFRQDGDGWIFSLELKSAYRCPALTELRRTFTFDPVRGLQLIDRFSFSDSGERIIERFITLLRPEIKTSLGTVILPGIQQNLVLKYTPEVSTPTVTTHIHRDHFAQDVEVFSLDFEVPHTQGTVEFICSITLDS